MINIAVAGCGYWGPNLIRNFRSLSDVAVRQVCDLDTSRLARMTQLYPEVEVTTDYDELVQNPDIDAIAIATPVQQHYDFARKSLLAGKHTFIEKPMASSVIECQELIELADNRRLKLMVGHTFIYTHAVQKIKEIVDSGALGKVFYISSQRLNLGLFQKDINVAWDLAPHDLSIILFIFGGLPNSVNCQGKAHVFAGIEDVTNITLDFPNGGYATVHSSWLDPNKVRNMTIVGSKKMIVYDDTQPLEKIKIFDKRVETPPHYDTFAEFHYSYHYGDIYVPYIKQVEPLKTQCQHFIDSIVHDRQPLSGGTEGLQVVQVLEAASESLKQKGARVELAEVAKVANGARKGEVREVVV